MTMIFPHENNVEDMLIHNCTISGSPVLEVGEFQILNTRQETECSVAESVARSVVEAAAPHDPVPGARPASVNSWSFVPRLETNSGAETSSHLSFLFVTLLMLCS